MPDADEANSLPSVSTGITESTGITTDEVDRFASSIYGNPERLLYGLAGSFRAGAVTEQEGAATRTEGGLLIVAAGDSFVIKLNTEPKPLVG